MSKSKKLKKLYQKIELDTPEERNLLSTVRSGHATNQELDDLLEIVQGHTNGILILNEIRDFENSLKQDINKRLSKLEEIENEDNDLAHSEDEIEKEIRYKDIKKRYKKNVEKAEEIIDAIKIAYFQIDSFDEYEDRLYNVRQNLSHLE